MEPIVASQTLRSVPADQLYRKTDPSSLQFATTADLEPIEGLVGQERALEAIRFGSQVDKAGFNLFVIGPHGARMQAAVKAVLAEDAYARPRSSDWVYVNNFADPDKPIAIELPAGRARAFQAAMHKLIDDLKTALPAVFRSEDYQTRRSAIDESFQKRQSEAFSALGNKAAEQHIAMVRTPLGFALAPAKNGRVVSPEEFNTWSEEDRHGSRSFSRAWIVVCTSSYEQEIDEDCFRKLAADTGLTIKQTFTGTSLSDPAAYTQALGHVKERLVVMSRGVLAPELVLSIGSRRRVPVLVIAPSDYAPQAQ